VLQSGYARVDKAHWLGSIDRWVNVIERTNVPNCRVRFRYKTFQEEWNIIKGETQFDSLELFTTERMLLSPRHKTSLVSSPRLNHTGVEERITGGHKLTEIAPRLKRMKSGLPLDAPLSPSASRSPFFPAGAPSSSIEKNVWKSHITSLLIAALGFLLGLFLVRRD
jgi:hypothetical protein